MKLNYDKKSKDPTYFIQQGFRIGKKTTTKNIFRIGKHSELLKITNDPLSYAKEKVKEYNEKMNENKLDLNLKINVNEKLDVIDKVSKSTSINIGYAFLQQIYSDLKLKKFFDNLQVESKAEFDFNEINRFLTFARIIWPSSKLATLDLLNNFYERPNFEYQHILRFMDVLYDNYDSYLEHLYQNSNNVIERDTSVCYYDCSNFYFETEIEDEDYIDPITNETVKGLRKYGLSKEHRPNPIVEMGLFMDAKGIPISMSIEYGSINEQLTTIPTEKKMIKSIQHQKLIYCSDAGLGSYETRKFNSECGRAFIVTQSIKKLSKPLQEAVFNDCDYRKLSDNSKTTLKKFKEFDKDNIQNIDMYNDFAYKVINADKAIDTGLMETYIDSNGKKKTKKSQATLKQRIIITFSRKVMEYQRYIRNRQIERAKKLLTLKNPDEIKKSSNDVRRLLKRTSIGSDGKKATDTYILDKELIAEEEKYDGFYAIATNLDDNAKDILAINSNRYQIEDCFRILKTNFSARPVNHRLRERIIAHFAICYTALLIFRLLENKLKEKGKFFSPQNIITTIKNMNVVNMQEVFYQSTYTGSEVCTGLNELYNLGLDKKYYQTSELNKIFKKFLK